METLDRVISKIRSDSTKIVSFDIFDTVICRNVAYPRDLLELYDTNFNAILEGFPLLSFSQERFALEDQLRGEVHKNRCTQEEVTFDEIYEYIQRKLGLSDDQIQQLKSLELEIERKHLQPRHSAVGLMHEAVNAGKTVVLLSDMYLPEQFVKEVLSRRGIKKFDRIYLSSTFGKKKLTGSLFKKVLEDYDIPPSGMLHIGDNYESDIKPAKRLGISTIHFKKAIDVFLQMEGNQSLLGGRLKKADLGYRTVIGFLANKFFDNPFRKVNNFSLFNGDVHWLGYSVYGPLLLFMCKWIIEESLLEGYEEINFLARDGFVLNKIYPLLAKFYDNPPKTRYIFASRNIFLPWSLRHRHCVPFTHHYVGIQAGHITFRKLLSERFDLEITQDLVEELGKEGFTDLDLPVGERLSDFLQTMSHQKFGISDRSIQKVALARKYYRQFFDPKKKQVCFDIGWRGTSQIYMSELMDCPIDFFYLGCKNLAFASQYKYGYKAKSYMHYKNEFFLDYNTFPFLLESIFGDSRSSTCINFRENGNKIDPVFSGKTSTTESQEIIETIQNGIMDFANDFLNWSGDDVTNLHAIPEHFLAPVFESIDRPFPIDAKSLQDLAGENILMVGKPLAFAEIWNRKTRKKQIFSSVNYHRLSNKFKTTYKNLESNHPAFFKLAILPTYKVLKLIFRPILTRWANRNQRV